MVLQTVGDGPPTVATYSVSEILAATGEKFRGIFLDSIRSLFAYCNCREVCEVTLVPAVIIQPDRDLH
jgi:hypothetical protein